MSARTVVGIVAHVDPVTGDEKVAMDHFMVRTATLGINLLPAFAG